MTDSMPAPFPPQDAPMIQEPFTGRMPPPLPPRARPSDPEGVPFSHQPRHIKALTVLFFPFYAIPRLGLKMVEEVAKQTYQFAKVMWSVSCKVYRSCEVMYETVAPIIWRRVVLPIFVRPLSRYIITPVVWIFRIIYDLCEDLVRRTATAIAEVYRCWVQKEE